MSYLPGREKLSDTGLRRAVDLPLFLLLLEQMQLRIDNSHLAKKQERGAAPPRKCLQKQLQIEVCSKMTTVSC